jgi:type II secretory pathway pseudopilin PulG
MTTLPDPTHAAPLRPSRRAEAGFTLVEALCAIVILVFGLMAITNLLLVAASSNTIANQSTAATTAATQRIEVLKRTPFATLATGGAVDGSDPAFCEFATSGITGLGALQGVGQIRTCWQLTQIDAQTFFIRVRSEGTGALTRARSRAEFTVVRACTDQTGGLCPAGPPGLP